MMDNYHLIAEQENTTVMAHYEALPREERISRARRNWRRRSSTS